MSPSFPTVLDIAPSRRLGPLSWAGPRNPCPQEGVHGDTYPLCWARDGSTYLSAGDPNCAFLENRWRHVPWKEAIENASLYPHVGGVDIERMSGVPPRFAVEQINTMPGFMGPGGNGPKPTGLVCVEGNLYLAVQNLLGRKPARHRQNCQHGSDATILRSDDGGRSWQPDIQALLSELEALQYDRRGMNWRTPPEQRDAWQGWRPMFPGSLFGGPSFVQFGRDNGDAVDGFVYAVSSDQWDNGSEIRLGRVPADKILDTDSWEWAVPLIGGEPGWTRVLSESGPVLAVDGHLSLPEMIYIPSVRRYLLLTWALHRDFDASGGSELTVLEAEHPWGPFFLVHYQQMWDRQEVCPYCPRIPLQWFDARNLTGWLLHSGNWHGTEYYKTHLRQFSIGERGERS